MLSKDLKTDFNDTDESNCTMTQLYLTLTNILAPANPAVKAFTQTERILQDSSNTDPIAMIVYGSVKPSNGRILSLATFFGVIMMVATIML